MDNETYTIRQAVFKTATEIAAHMKMRSDGYYSDEYYKGILFGIEGLVGNEIYSRALDAAKTITEK